MKKKIKIIKWGLSVSIGVLLMLGSMWGGAYACYKVNDWMLVPTFITSTVIFIGGIVLTVVSASEFWDSIE